MANIENAIGFTDKDTYFCIVFPRVAKEWILVESNSLIKPSRPVCTGHETLEDALYFLYKKDIPFKNHGELIDLADSVNFDFWLIGKLTGRNK